MRKRWINISIILGLLAVGIVGGGAILAQSEGSDGQSRLDSFVSRVAENLGIEDEATVRDAINQAVREMKDEAVQEKLNRKVEAGFITREKADEYMEWYLSRPDDDLNPGLFRGFKGHFFGKGKGHHSHSWYKKAPADESPSTK